MVMACCFRTSSLMCLSSSLHVCRVVLFWPSCCAGIAGCVLRGQLGGSGGGVSRRGEFCLRFSCRTEILLACCVFMGGVLLFAWPAESGLGAICIPRLSALRALTFADCFLPSAVRFDALMHVWILNIVQAFLLAEFFWVRSMSMRFVENAAEAHRKCSPLPYVAFLTV